jgi:hypothetical protein
MRVKTVREHNNTYGIGPGRGRYQKAPAPNMSCPTRRPKR